MCQCFTVIGGVDHRFIASPRFIKIIIGNSFIRVNGTSSFSIIMQLGKKVMFTKIFLEKQEFFDIPN